MNPVKRLLHAAIVPVLILLYVGSASGDAGVESYRGFYVYGGEARTFQPCGSEKVYWVRAAEAISNRLRSAH